MLPQFSSSDWLLDVTQMPETVVEIMRHLDADAFVHIFHFFAAQRHCADGNRVFLPFAMHLNIKLNFYQNLVTFWVQNRSLALFQCAKNAILENVF